MASLPVEILLGISLGLLIGVVPVLVIGAASFTLEYVADRALSPAVVVALAVALGGVQASIVDVVGPADGGAQSAVAAALPRLVVATVVVALVSLYANSQAAALASRLPRDVSQPTSRERPLSVDALDAVDGMGQVTIRSAGEVRNLNERTPLSPALRTALEDGRWRLPADAPLVELESRLEDRLRTDFDLAAVSVSIDARGRATIAASPPSKSLARRLSDGWRALSVTTLLPSGLAPDDEVAVSTGDGTTTGVVLGTTDGVPSQDGTEGGPDDGDLDGESTAGSAVTEATGGRGRVTVAVPTVEAGDLLETDAATIAARPRGTSHEFEAFSLLERAGQSVRKVQVGDGTPDVVASLDDEIEVLAVRESEQAESTGGTWTFDPPESLAAADAAYVIGDGHALEGLQTTGDVETVEEVTG